MAEEKARVKNFNIAVKEWNDQIIFLRKLVPGGTNRSYGIQVARLAGIPESVIRSSKKILARIESHAPTGSHASGNSPRTGKRKQPVQINLFRPVEEEVIDLLQKIDLDQTTPMEALRILERLHEKVKAVIY